MDERVLQVEAIQEFITHKGSDTKNFHFASIIAVGVALCTCPAASTSRLTDHT